MTARRFAMPKSQPKPLDGTGAWTKEYQHYLGGIEVLSKRVTEAIEPLPNGAASSDIVNKINELIAAMQASDQMES